MIFRRCVPFLAGCHRRKRQCRGIRQSPPKIDRVIGPAFGAITLADKFADVLNVKTGFAVESGPLNEDGTKKFAMEKRFSVSGEHILVVEDTITTGGSVVSVIEAAEAAGAKVLPAQHEVLITNPLFMKTNKFRRASQRRSLFLGKCIFMHELYSPIYRYILWAEDR